MSFRGASINEILAGISALNAKVWFGGILTIVDYLIANLFSCIQTVLFQAILFSQQS